MRDTLPQQSPLRFAMLGCGFWSRFQLATCRWAGVPLWVDPAYAVVHSSIVACHRNLLRGLLREDGLPETTAEDNLKSLQLVFAAYESARRSAVVPAASDIAPHAARSQPKR